MESQLHFVLIGFALGNIVTGIIAIYLILRRKAAFDAVAKQALQDVLNLSVIKAQMRAFQEYALRREGKMMVYNIQKANGRFAKVLLPEIK